MICTMMMMPFLFLAVSTDPSKVLDKSSVYIAIESTDLFPSNPIDFTRLPFRLWDFFQAIPSEPLPRFPHSFHRFIVADGFVVDGWFDMKYVFGYHIGLAFSSKEFISNIFGGWCSWFRQLFHPDTKLLIWWYSWSCWSSIKIKPKRLKANGVAQLHQCLKGVGWAW